MRPNFVDSFLCTFVENNEKDNDSDEEVDDDGS